MRLPITIPLDVLIDALTQSGCRPSATVETWLAKLIQEADPNEVETHVELAAADLSTVWRIKDWREDQQRRLIARQRLHEEHQRKVEHQQQLEKQRSVAFGQLKRRLPHYTDKQITKLLEMAEEMKAQGDESLAKKIGLL